RGQKRVEAGPSAEQRDRDVADLGIAKWVDELSLLEEGIAHYRVALAALWPAMESAEEARSASERAWMNLEQATAREDRHRETASRLERQAMAAEIACEAAGQAANASLAEILERVDKNRQRLEQLRAE